MLLNLSNVITQEGMTFEKSVEPDMSGFRYFGETYPIKKSSSLSLAAVNLEKGKAKLNGTMNLIFEIPCDRCLRTVESEIEVTFEKEVYAPNYRENENDEEELFELEDGFMEGYSLNVEQLIYSEIIINWPMKILCTEDCKGICKSCGQNLNEGTCTCDNFVPDPRLASIKDIFNNANKEV